jgi:hypothetical protein
MLPSPKATQQSTNSYAIQVFGKAQWAIQMSLLSKKPWAHSSPFSTLLVQKAAQGTLADGCAVGSAYTLTFAEFLPFRTRNLTVVPIVEKGLAATRPVAKQKALEALLLYIELDKADPIIEELLPLLAHKQPKIIAATLAALREIYKAYGCKTVEPKPTLKALPKIYGHADKNVRAEGQALTVELYRWLREAMKPLFWNDLKPVQQTDLEKLFEKVKDEPPPKQERLLRSQQAAIEAAPPQAEADEDDVIAYDDEAEIDLEPEYVAVNVLAKMPKDFYERLASSKWKDRKEALDELHTAINHPKLEDGQYSDLCAALAKCMKDANIAVVTVAAGSIEILAKGLRKSFARYKGTVMGPMMERLKEKKQSVTDAIAAALDAVFAATNGFADCLEEMLEFLKHKNPQVKLESTKFLIRALCTTRDPPAPPELKSMVDGSTKLLTESAAPQREAGAEVLGTLWKIMGDRVMNPHLEGLDDIRKQKIKEYQEKAEVKAKYKPKPVAPPPKAAPVAQKRAPAGKKPAPARKAAPPPRAPSPFDDDPPPAPLAARPSSRPASKIVAKGSGLRPPGGLRKPQAIPGPYSQSPARKVASPVEEAPIPQPKLSGLNPGRGLAGRPLGKPAPQRAATPESPPSTYTRGGLSGLSSAERAELEELRVEVERLRRENEHIRQEKGRISSQIHELTNQNAQLIEDHTRDVLSIKAKETQLVRARSDEEEAHQQVQQQQREIDRLKRELSRQVRASSPAPMDLSEQIYNDDSRNNGGFSTSSYGQQPRNSRSYVTSPTDSIGKENFQGPHPASLRSKLSSPPLVGGRDRDMDSSYGPPSFAPPSFEPASPRRGLAGPGVEIGRSATTGSIAGAGGQAGGAESWKRAAEVTQNLKARIELMKVCSPFAVDLV